MKTKTFESGNPKPTFKDIVKGVCLDFLNLIAGSLKVLKWIALGILIILAIEILIYLFWW